MLVAGVAIVAAGIGLVAYVFLRDTTVSPTIVSPTESPFIAVDAVRPVSLPARPTRATVLEGLNNARLSSDLSLGLIERLVITTPSNNAKGETVPVEMPAPELFQYFAAHVPPALVRTIKAPYLLGIHSFDENQAFLIAQVDSYETAYAGMLEWESTMYTDLQPLFIRTPPVHLTGTATSTPAEPGVIMTGFVDKIVENRDVRAKVTEQGDLLLFWTFLNRSTVLIATNEFTLREVISRFSAPVQTVPGS
jgi:hypothetical protein